MVGRVEYDGKPVTGGSLTLAPKGEGKPGAATISSDGTFVVSTYEVDDGAVIGAHEVRYRAPTPDTPVDAKGHSAPPPSPYAGLVPKSPEVVIGTGGADLVIELVEP